MRAKKLSHEFPGGEAEDPLLLGGKGAGLDRMGRLGLPVPPGFTLTTRACEAYLKAGALPAGLLEEILERLGALEEKTGKRLGGPKDPLLVSVRSGAPVSMPGMMDTVLNVGLNGGTVEGLARKTGDRRFAYDSYRRLVQMFAGVVLGMETGTFEEALRRPKDERGVEDDADLTAEDLEQLVAAYKGIIQEAGKSFPENPREQLELAVRAVFDSWNNDRAFSYRRQFGIPDDLGTAVTVQAMVFGNMGEGSATGVAFTRNPATGEQGLFGEFLPNAQGEDVVAGVRTPRPLVEMDGILPHALGELIDTMGLLEREYRDMQDVEFTVERGKLYLLQTRSGKRTAQAAVKIAREMAEEGLISKEEAITRVEPEHIERLLHPTIDPEVPIEVLCRGLGASPGAATGKVVLTADEAKERGEMGEVVILVRRQTDPDDVHGMIAARGVLTATGGMTSHAAVVARGMGKPAVTGCKVLKVDAERGEIEVAGRRLAAGDVLTIEGSTGAVILGEAPLVSPVANKDLETILAWADGVRTLGVRANADTLEDARRARGLGAEGIGLCRTEHMFMEDGRLEIVRRMILSEDEGALAELEPLQQGDFEEIFRAMDGLPVTIRLLDPPLHEFLPDSKDLLLRLADPEAAGDEEETAELRRRLTVVEGLEESNPMLGLRGVRLGITRPEVYRMQVRAIARGIETVHSEGGTPVAEVMIPLVGFPAELELARGEAEAVLGEVLGADHGVAIGTMMELPRACLVAEEIAKAAGFFSFGTNDLTQTACGLSRDDAEGGFLIDYLEGGILQENPFETIDRPGVGSLVSMACRLGREANPDLGLGVCGEHGGDPQSIAFFREVGLDYVSCSPYRVPVARLAAARAEIEGRETPAREAGPSADGARTAVGNG